MKIKSLIIILAMALICLVQGAEEPQSYQYARDIAYRPASDAQHTNQLCQLDVAYRPQAEHKPVVVWFHGGGLTAGRREIPEALLKDQLVIMGVEYRLAPEVNTDEIIDDAAAAVAWAFDHCAEYGGDAKKIFIAGHSAGGYLVNMVALDQSRLKKYGKEANDLAGVIPYSGHSITHFTTRSTAPLFYVRADAPPLLILSGDRELELYGRYEESAFFWRMLKLAGHKDSKLLELDGFDHGTMVEPAHLLALRFIRERSKQK
jgi:acetyl esterase/lipase